MEPAVQATLLHSIAALANVYYIEALSGPFPLGAVFLSTIVLRLASQKIWKDTNRQWWVTNGMMPFLMVLLGAWTILINI